MMTDPFNLSDEDLEQMTLDFDLEETGLLEEADRTVESKRELLTLRLLREAIAQTNPDDSVLQDFSNYVLPNLLKYAIGVSAKGGWFFDELDRRVAQGDRDPLSHRHNAADQSLNTHLLNGLFPANLIERRLQTLNTNVRRYIKNLERRILIASFILHDFEKFDLIRFPQLFQQYQQYHRNLDLDLRKAGIESHRELFDVLVPALGLDQFIDPDNPETWKTYRDDLLYIAYNTQIKNDTNLNLSGAGLQPELRDRTLTTLTDLTRLADLLASIIKHPHDAVAETLKAVLHQLSDGQLQFTYHAITENRGVLTNIVNNAIMEAHTALNHSIDETAYYQPLLYLPTGVVYLATRNAPPITLAELPHRVVAAIKERCAQLLIDRQTGFSRDGKGMKYADYYSQFFTNRGLMEVAQRAVLRILHPKKPSKASDRSQSLLKFQQQGALSAEFDFDFGDDIRIDRIAEFGDVVTRKIWGDRRASIEAYLKATLTGKTAKTALLNLPNPNLVEAIAHELDLEDILPAIRNIQKINENLKNLKMKGNTGGLPLDWYYLAAQYVHRNPNLSQDEGDIGNVGDHIIAIVEREIQPIVESYEIPDGWDDLREWVRRIVVLPGHDDHTIGEKRLAIFRTELEHYELAKKPGRGRQLLCSISHSSDSVTEQMESAVLFTPQVYTNKQMLGGSNAKRNISSIAGVEMMLRQILMNQTQAIGKAFEDSKYRYLYFYPTYYFTPETNSFVAKAYSSISQTRFDTSIRSHFIDKETLRADFSQVNYQQVDSFLIDENLKVTLTDANEKSSRVDRTFKLAYPDDKPLTFFFIALPPGRDPTDTESWVMPSWMALALPTILDVKTVVSESPIPPYRDGTEFEETVFLDSAPQAFWSLLRRDRFRINHILEGWQDDCQRQQTSPLNTLTAAYAIHLDVNPKRGKTGYDANWGKLADLASHLETSPLYVFHYLAKFARSLENDAPSHKRIQLYCYDLYPCFDPFVQGNRQSQELIIMSPESPLNHPKELVRLYRRFYRANKSYNPKSNAVLKPVDVASDTILKAESTIFQGEGLVETVAAEVFKLMDRVHQSTAEGRWQIQDREQERQAILDFARYFVIEVFEKSFKSNRARMAGKQINLIRDTCEFLYRLEQDQENREKTVKSKEEDESE